MLLLAPIDSHNMPVLLWDSKYLRLRRGRAFKKKKVSILESFCSVFDIKGKISLPFVENKIYLQKFVQLNRILVAIK